MKAIDIGGRFCEFAAAVPRKRGGTTWLGAAVAMVVGLAACGGSTPAKPATAAPATLTVWLMTGEISPTTFGAVNAAFQKQFPQDKVNVEIQQWSGIGAKITTALASNAAPDVLEIGNTDVPEFAGSGGLMDLTSHRSNLEQGGHWLTGLSAPAIVGGKLYAAPLLAGDRVVIYNKDMFAKAGVSVPTSESQLMQAGQQLMAANQSTPNFSALYWPGKYWYAALPLIWDRGGDIAARRSGKWQGSLTSSQTMAGLEAFKQLQNTLSAPASRSLNTSQPDQDTVLANGQAGMIIGGGWEVGAILKDNPALTGKLGAFAFPSTTAGQSAPVFLGGSDVAVAANSTHKQLALEWVKLMTAPSYQTAMQKNDGLMPNTTTLLGLAGGDPIQSVFYEAAKSSRGTPASAGWATIEGDNTMENLFSGVATGTQSTAAAAQATDDHLNSVLNQSS
jgi:N,N'-diacetylchitobiose transport system substrate-binding protein